MSVLLCSFLQFVYDWKVGSEGGIVYSEKNLLNFESQYQLEAEDRVVKGAVGLLDRAAYRMSEKGKHYSVPHSHVSLIHPIQQQCTSTESWFLLASYFIRPSDCLFPLRCCCSQAKSPSTILIHPLCPRAPLLLLFDAPSPCLTASLMRIILFPNIGIKPRTVRASCPFAFWLSASGARWCWHVFNILNKRRFLVTQVSDSILIEK